MVKGGEMIIMIILMVLAAVAVGTLLVQVGNLRKENTRLFQKAVLDLHMSMDGRCAVRGSWGQCPHCLFDTQEWEFDQRYHGFIKDWREEDAFERYVSEYDQAYLDECAGDWQFEQMFKPEYKEPERYVRSWKLEQLFS